MRWFWLFPRADCGPDLLGVTELGCLSATDPWLPTACSSLLGQTLAIAGSPSANMPASLATIFTDFFLPTRLSCHGFDCLSLPQSPSLQKLKLAMYMSWAEAAAWTLLALVTTVRWWLNKKRSSSNISEDIQPLHGESES